MDVYGERGRGGGRRRGREGERERELIPPLSQSSQPAPTSDNNTKVQQVAVDIGEDMGGKHKEDVSLF